MEERGSHLDMDGFRALACSHDNETPSLERVLKCLTRQNILTELKLDSSLESLNIMFFFLEQLSLLTTHVRQNVWFSFQSTQLLMSQARKLVPSPLAIENSKIAHFKT